MDSGKGRVYDYVDREGPMLARMFERRLKGYQAIGYSQAERMSLFAGAALPLGTTPQTVEAGA